MGGSPSGLLLCYSHTTERGQPCFAQTTLVTCPHQVRDLQEHLQDIQKQLLDLF